MAGVKVLHSSVPGYLGSVLQAAFIYVIDRTLVCNGRSGPGGDFCRCLDFGNGGLLVYDWLRYAAHQGFGVLGSVRGGVLGGLVWLGVRSRVRCAVRRGWVMDRLGGSDGRLGVRHGLAGAGSGPNKPINNPALALGWGMRNRRAPFTQIGAVECVVPLPI